MITGNPRQGGLPLGGGHGRVNHRMLHRGDHRGMAEDTDIFLTLRAD